MNAADAALAQELGQQFRHLIDLAKTDDDPGAVLLGEEIQALSHDDAHALLMVAVLLAVHLESS